MAGEDDSSGVTVEAEVLDGMSEGEATGTGTGTGGGEGEEAADAVAAAAVAAVDTAEADAEAAVVPLWHKYFLGGRRPQKMLITKADKKFDVGDWAKYRKFKEVLKEFSPDPVPATLNSLASDWCAFLPLLNHLYLHRENLNKWVIVYSLLVRYTLSDDQAWEIPKDGGTNDAAPAASNEEEVSFVPRGKRVNLEFNIAPTKTKLRQAFSKVTRDEVAQVLKGTVAEWKPVYHIKPSSTNKPGKQKKLGVFSSCFVPKGAVIGTVLGPIEWSTQVGGKVFPESMLKQRGLDGDDYFDALGSKGDWKIHLYPKPVTSAAPLVGQGTGLQYVQCLPNAAAFNVDLVVDGTIKVKWHVLPNKEFLCFKEAGSSGTGDGSGGGGGGDGGGTGREGRGDSGSGNGKGGRGSGSGKGGGGDKTKGSAPGKKRAASKSTTPQGKKRAASKSTTPQGKSKEVKLCSFKKSKKSP